MGMEVIFVILLAIILFVAYLTFTKTLRDELSRLKSSVDTTKDSVSASLLENTRDITTRLERASLIIAELKKETGAFSEIGRSMKDLQDYLKSPKLRGNIGEMVLTDLISQIFPKSSYSLQYTFKSGDKVDVIVKTDAGLLPIDSKFPLENFQKMVGETNAENASTYKRLFAKDVRLHIRAISSKYLLPSEGTLDFALMYIPSESIYYEIVMQDELMDFARSSRVYPVSPSTLYAALQTILLSFEGRRVEAKAKEVFALLRGIQKEYEKAVGTFETLGTHVTNAYNKYSEVHTGLNTLGQKLQETRTLATSADPMSDNLIEKEV